MNMNSITRTRDILADKDDLDERALDEGLDESPSWRSTLRGWLADDSPYIVMLLLAVVGVALQPPLTYWLIIAPVFGVVCIVAGWRHVRMQEDHTQLVVIQALNWLAVLAAIYVLSSVGVQGVLNTNSTGLAMLALLALGAFTAGLQARVWRICAIGVILFVAVPFIAWFDQSILLIAAATLVVIAVGGLTWWMDQRRFGSAH